MRFSLTVKKAAAAALTTMAAASGVAALAPAAHAAPGNTVLVGDSMPANPTVEQYASTAVKIPNPGMNKAGCAADGSFAGGYSEAAGRAVADFTCPGASFATGGRHVSDLIDKAAEAGELNGATAEVVIFAGANDTYPHMLQNPKPLGEIEGMIHNGMVKAIEQARAKAPNARIKVVGYPQIGNAKGEVCAISLTPNGTVPTPAINVGGAEGALQNAGRKAAEQTGAQFVDLKGMSAGHEMCSPDRWIAGLVDFGSAPRALPLHLTWDGIKAVSTFVGRA